jgi:hypothetical protein
MTKKRAGRPKLKDTEKKGKIRTVNISDETHRFFTELGNGNFSEGIRIAKYIIEKGVVK